MRLLILIITTLFIPTVGLAATIFVPQDYNTIQEAIEASSKWDEIYVSPGTYFENINFNGKHVVVSSLYGAEHTVIDGNQADSVVTFESGESGASLLYFTITNGKSQGWIYKGGGITCTNASSPLIKENIITGNVSEHYGGGIHCDKSSSPNILDNTICDNLAEVGGGINCSDNSAPRIEYNLIQNNHAIDDFPPGSGSGGGISCGYNSNAIIRGNTICHNTTNGGGGGISCSSEAQIDMNIISNNTSDHGGGISIANSSPKVQNNIIEGNKASLYGGGIYLWDVAFLEIMNNSIVTNAAENGGGLACYNFSLSGTVDPVAFVTNTILWGNGATFGKEVWLSTNGAIYNYDLTFSHCDLEGGGASLYVDFWGTIHWGPGMIDLDPLLVDPEMGDFHLTWLSPCINMGTHENAPDHDVDYFKRPIMGTPDIGADEYGQHHEPHPLESFHTFQIHIWGSSIDFDLNGGSDNAGRDYLLMMSISGKVPGTPLPRSDKVLPLNWDAVTNIVIGASYPSSSMFKDFYGTLDAEGRMTAEFKFTDPIPNALGHTFTFAYVLEGPPWDFVSNPLDFEVVY